MVLLLFHGKVVTTDQALELFQHASLESGKAAKDYLK
jgi:hypothetical protein